MGKNFLLITTLKERPDLYRPTLALVEKAFKYSQQYSFEIDFAPLMQQSNWSRCFIGISEADEVIAHVGSLERKLRISDHSFPISMLGGIAVSEKFRGQGIFQQLFTHVMTELTDECAFFLLWSDNQKLYQKYGFHLCGEQFVIDKKDIQSEIGPTTLKDLSFEELIQIKQLYKTSFCNKFLSIERSDEDWETLKKISSANLFIKKSHDRITDYWFTGKGNDLEGITYEYGSENLEQLFQSKVFGGKIWAAKEFSPATERLYQFFLAPGSKQLFTQFISTYTKIISIREINHLKQEVFFDYRDELHCLELDEFLRGVFGPGTFEELQVQPIFISGLDSI
jgi:predicted N-acetyltransferase YhbS